MFIRRFALLLLFMPSVAQAAQFPPFYVRQQQYRFPASDPRCSKDAHCTSEIHRGENGQDYSLDFVEYKDNGEPFDQSQLDAAREQLRAARANNGRVIVFIYIHGWHNNAEDRDQGRKPRDCAENLYIGDVAKFRNCGLRVLAANYPATTTGAPPRVVGIYLAWHGTDFDWIPFYYVPSYPFRRSSARTVGLTGMAHALSSLFDVIEEQRDSYFVVAMGHSFGARVLEAADEFHDTKKKYPEAGILRERRLNPEFYESQTGTSRLPVDMVFYVNAATSHYMSIKSMKEWEHACAPREGKTKPPGCGQNPLYLAVSSRADLLTAVVMPIANVAFFDPFTDLYHLISRANTPWMQTHKIPKPIKVSSEILPTNAFCFAVPLTPTQKALYEVDPKDSKTPSMYWAMNTDHWIASLEEVVHAIPVLRQTIDQHWIISSHGDVWNTGVFNMVRAVVETQEQRANGEAVPCGQTTNGQKPASVLRK